MSINSLILSAGKGTRMKSELPKVVQKVAGVEMINMVLKSLNEAGISNNVLVVGYKKEEVINRVDSRFAFDFVEQTEQLGTGHAVKIAKEKMQDLEGVTIITCGDTPLVTSETFKSLINNHNSNCNDLTILTAKIDDPTNYGRIVRDADGLVKSIVEQKDADEETLLINEINSGIYCFENKLLFKHVDEIDNNNAQSEYYLPDLVQIFNNNSYKVGAYVTDNLEETYGVNDLVALSNASSILRDRINKEHMLNGVNILDPSNTYIDPYVEIGEGTIIYPNNNLSGSTKIGNNTTLLPGNLIVDSIVGSDCSIGPNSHLRANAILGDNCRIGNYVEIKKSNLGNDVKAAHLTYIGDSEVGNNVNFGCGSITANYDGVNKHLTTIGNDCFIGSNSVLIAPVNIGDNTLVAADTTVTNSVDSNSFVKSRIKQDTRPRR